MLSSVLVSLLLPALIVSFPLAPPQYHLRVSSVPKGSIPEPILPTCSSLTFSSPCQCPEGTSYESTTTYAVIGANAKHVQAVTGNFFDITWLGMVPRETAGPANSVGSTRTDYVRTMRGAYEFIEETLRWDSSPDGSFETAYKQQNNPILFQQEFGPGAFAGELVTWTAQYLGEHETAVSWSCYVCFTGGLNGFPEFHEMGITNATKILDAQGKLKGKSIKPWSTTYSKGAAAWTEL
ncbi:MAG: hypothetical protein Q9226_004053 [Calogaya cf. arnoldii]